MFSFVLLLAIGGARAQFKEPAAETGVRFDKESVNRVQVGIIVEAVNGPCAGLTGSTPVPIEWPEQQVRIVEEDISPNVGVSYQMVAGTVRQMAIRIPSLPQGQRAQALVTFEVRRHTLLPPEDTSGYQIPRRIPRKLRMYKGGSPYIETRNSLIRKAARDAIAGSQETDWEKVESIYDWVRDKVEYKEGKLKGALAALRDGNGDCEELSSLFIAMCRVNGIPARTVWVPGHCYPEFYLENKEGKGRWFPCQAAGTRDFGGIPEVRPILQKGDNFRVPGRKKPMRYVSEILTGSTLPGGSKPNVKFVRHTVQESVSP